MDVRILNWVVTDLVYDSERWVSGAVATGSSNWQGKRLTGEGPCPATALRDLARNVQMQEMGTDPLD